MCAFRISATSNAGLVIVAALQNFMPFLFILYRIKRASDLVNSMGNMGVDGCCPNGFVPK